MKESNFLILGSLSKKPTHPYDLLKIINDKKGIGLIWKATKSNLYQDIAYLKKMGLISCEVFRQENRPDKKVYRLTKKGMEVYQKWLSAPVMHGRDIRHQFLAKYFFIKAQAPKTLDELITKQIEVVKEILENQKQKYHCYRGEFGEIVLDFRMNQMNAILNWLENIQKREMKNEK